jgi:hypothetical protein
MKFRYRVCLLSLIPTLNLSWAGEVHYCRSLHQISFSELEAAKVPSWEGTLHVSQDGTWHFDLPLEEVYALYTTTPMSGAWASKFIINRFTLVPGSAEPVDVDTRWYESQKPRWANDWPDLSERSKSGYGSTLKTWPGLTVGTRIFLDIKGALFTHFCDMAIGFEVTRAVPNQLIEINYLDFSPPYGTQRISFAADPEGGTTVTQVSYYRGKDRFLDFLYRPFHREEIPGLHERMQELARKRSQEIGIDAHR